jgi:hypothetical protein
METGRVLTLTFTHSTGDRGAIPVVHSTDLSFNADEFLAKIKAFDSNFAQISAQNTRSAHSRFSLAPKGVTLEWEHPANSTGGRFCVFFNANTLAFRTYCILCWDWLSGALKFPDDDNNIVGIMASLKYRVWSCQIWVRDGFNSSLILGRWQFLIQWLQTSAGVKDANFASLLIEFRAHPNYRHRGESPEEIRREANGIPSFAACIDKLTRREPPDVPPHPDAARVICVPFNFAIATKFKRSRSERRRTITEKSATTDV